MKIWYHQGYNDIGLVTKHQLSASPCVWLLSSEHFIRENNMRRAVVKIQILVEGNVLEQFLMTIFSTTEPGNVGTMLQPFKTMLD